VNDPVLACIEVGGSGVQTVVFGVDGTAVFLDGPHQPPGACVALAVPGLIDGHRVASASNLGWIDVNPVAELGLRGAAVVVCNDAEAAALGEAELRGLGPDTVLAFVGLGTGVGGAVVAGSEVLDENLFGHGGAFGDRLCRCGRTGCLETVAAGWALPDALGDEQLRGVAAAVAVAVAAEPAADPAAVIVVGGGIVRRHPNLVAFVQDALPTRAVEASAAPPAAKSAAAWGLRRLSYGFDAVLEGGRS